MPKGAFAADAGAQQIVAGSAFDLAAQPHDVAIGRDEFHTQRVIDRDAIFQRVRPTRIRRDVAADGARRLR
jgi:hypothetical protein